MHSKIMKTIILLALITCLFASLTFANDEEDEFREVKMKIIKPEVISSSFYDIDHDGKKEKIEIIINEGVHIISDYPWCGDGERWEGRFTIKVTKGRRVLFKHNLNEMMPEYGIDELNGKFVPKKIDSETLSFWAPQFSLVFRDYNNDGQIDFNLGQYGGCAGNNFWLFTISKKGIISPLLVNGKVDNFYIQDPRHFNSTDDPILEPDRGLFRHSTFDRGEEIEYSIWYKWDRQEFVTVKTKEKSFREPFKDFPIKAEQLVGKWASESSHAIELKADGTFQAVCDHKGITFGTCSITGRWYIHNNHFIWIYDEDYYDFKKGQEDNNTIIDFETDQFLLRENGGGTTAFKRNK
jgi:hypothetical protein